MTAEERLDVILSKFNNIDSSKEQKKALNDDIKKLNLDLEGLKDVEINDAFNQLTKFRKVMTEINKCKANRSGLNSKIKKNRQELIDCARQEGDYHKDNMTFGDHEKNEETKEGDFFKTKEEEKPVKV